MSKLSDVLLRTDAAWLCAVARDVEREEQEQREARARRQRGSIPLKFELEDAGAQLDHERTRVRVERRLKSGKCVKSRPHKRLPPAASSNNISRNGISSSNNQQPKSPVASAYAAENARLVALLRDRSTIVPHARRCVSGCLSARCSWLQC